MAQRFDRFTEGARKVLTLAQEEAHRFNLDYVGTEHLLLGLVREGDGVAARVLSDLGMDLPRVRRAVEFVTGRGDAMVVHELALTPRTKKVLELAVDEARRLNHHVIGTEHLLLGLVREGDGVAARVLSDLGVDLEQVRPRVLAAANSTDPPPAGGPATRVAPDVRDLSRELIARLQGGTVDDPDEATRRLLGYLHRLLGEWLESHDGEGE